MPDFTKIAEAFGLDADANEDQILTAARETQEKAEQAPAEGQVLIAQAELDTLKAAQTSETKLAARIESLESDASTQRFEVAFDKALNDPKGARVLPAEKDGLRKFFDADEEAFTASLDARPALVNAKPAGHGGGNAEVPSNVEEESFNLDREAKTYMAEKGCDYRTAVFHVENQRSAA